jgi:hypothetical protein
MHQLKAWLACGLWRPENGQPAAGVKLQYRRISAWPYNIGSQ